MTEAAIEFTVAKVQTLAGGGARLYVDVSEADQARAFSMFGQNGCCGAMVRLTPEAAKRGAQNETIAASYGHWWRDLIASGFFNAPPVLEAIGTDKAFREWVQRQPSCVSGEFDHDPDTGDERCEACHVRRVNEGSGTGTKPEYFCVPMTHAEHAKQHQKGEGAVLKYHGKEGAKDWFASKATHYRIEWASKTLAAKFGHDSRKDCPPQTVQAWVIENELMQYLPDRLRN